MSHSPRFRMGGPLVALLVAAAPLGAQSSGLNSSDLIINLLNAAKGATLELVHEGTGAARRLSPDGRGEARFRLLAAGNYRLRVEAPGFRTLSRKEVHLQVGTTQRLDLRLEPEAQATVAVEGRLDTPDNLRTQVSAQVDRQALAQLPIDRRSFASLSLATGLALVSRGPVDAGAPDSGLSLAGASPRQNSFLVDGLDNNDLGNGAQRVGFSQEAIQEFQVIAGMSGVESGRALGGTLNAVTRSGGNQASGSAFLTHRPGSLDARNPAGGDGSEYRLTQMGASFGGPLVKDKVFGFIAVERLRRQDQGVVSIDPFVVSAIQGAGFHVERGGLPAEEQSQSVFGRLDWVLNGSNRLSFTAVQSDEHLDDQIPWGGLVARSSGARRDTRNLALTLSHQWLPTDWLAQDLRVLYTTRDNRLSSLDPDRSVQVELQGSAIFGSQRFTPQETHTSYLQIVDVLTASLGTHTLKGGFDLLSTLNRGVVQQNFSGYYLFTAIPQAGIPTSVAAFLAPNPFGGQGLPAAFLQAFGNAGTRFRTTNLALFLQDEWQPSPTLWLRAGLRWDRVQVPEFDATPDYQALGNPPSSVDPILGPTRLPDGPYPYTQLFRIQRDWSHQLLAPRASFNWQPDGQWRVYGGVGTSLGALNLAPVFGNRLINGQNIVGVFRTLLDSPFQGPWISWANGDGLAQNHRYSAPPAGNRVLAIPGENAGARQHQQNLGAEWTPAPAWRVALDLTWSQGRHLMNLRDVNPFLPLSPTLLRRPDLRYGPIYRTDDSGESRYQGQTLSVDWKANARFTLRSAYTHSKAEDNLTDWGATLGAQSPWDPMSEWGPSYQDQRNRVVLSGIWQSPAQHWTASFLFRAGSGRPYTKLLGYDANYDGDPGPDRPAGLGRNSETGPWTRQVDVRLARNFSLGSTRLELMVDLFNLFNTVNVTEVQNSLASVQPPYGSPIRFGPARQLQVGARLSF